MILSKRWLSDYVDIQDDIKTFDRKMTLTGSKVEGYSIEGEELKNIVVGKIVALEKHENADTLWVCQLDIGQDAPIQIVTGANNVNVNDVVPVALHKSIVHGGQKITKGKLRGVVSNGMLCSLQELGLNVADFPYAIEDGIFLLGDDCDKTLGLDIQTAIGLNDTMIEFEITPNRPDCLSVVGLAREAAATFNVPLNLPEPKVKEGHGDVSNFLSVEINTDKCYRYIGAIVENVRIQPSPRWLRERLRASGIRPINNIVDITNYVMLEYGQPMHAFDLRYLDGGKVNVRMAKKDEKITTLDDVERILTEDMMIIADANKPVAIAGVMGGEYSGIMPDTTTIVFESACFNGVSVRKTSKALGLRTEASSRYEKELSPSTCPTSLDRALELVQLLDAGDIVNGSIDVNHADLTPKTVPFDPDWINSFLGTDIPRETQIAYLEKIDFKVDGDVITVPLYRGDVTIPADITEEVARFYGYDNIPARELSGVANARITPMQTLENICNETFRSLGLNEIITFSFYSPKSYDMIHLKEDSPLRNSVVISNPLGEDTSVMRSTAIPSMMATIQRNYNTQILSGALYEMAMVYQPVVDEKLPHEQINATIGLFGEEYDFFHLKGILEELLDKVGINHYNVEAITDNPTFHPGRTAIISKDSKKIAILGQIHPEVAQEYGVDTPCFVAELDMEVLFDLHHLERTYKPLPKFPASTRDLAFVCDKSIPVLTLERDIAKAVGSILESIALFDVYEGKQIGENKKSVAFNLVLRSSEKTLTDEEIDAAMQRVIQTLEKRGINLRS